MAGEQKKRRLGRWIEKRDTHNQAAMDALRPPPIPSSPAVVLQALTSIPDPAFAYRLRVQIDGHPLGDVAWGWSVHPLPLGEHEFGLYHRSGTFPRASPATIRVVLDDEHPVVHLVYEATAMGLRPGRASVMDYQGPPAGN